MSLFTQHSNEAQERLKKALSSAGTSGALSPEDLEAIITNELIRLRPELAILAGNAKKISSSSHDFNRRDTAGAPNGAVGENSTTPTRSSGYTRDSVALKIIRRKGAVTNFLQDTAEGYLDAAAQEMENVIEDHANDLNFFNLYGNKDANSYEYDGVDKFISTNRVQFHTAGAPTELTSLSTLDAMIDKNARKGGTRHKRAFLMTPEMHSKINQLITSVRLTQQISDTMGKVTIDGGHEVFAYRGIPIIESTFMGGAGVGTMTTVGTATATTGGTLANDTYYYQVTKVTLQGESMASAEVSQVTGAANVSTVTLSWTTDTDALQYRIYSSLSTGLTAMTLLRVVAGQTYDGNGTPTGNTASIILLNNTPDATVPTHMQADFPPSAASGYNGESVLLWDFDPYQGLGKYVYTHSAGNRNGGLVQVNPLAITDDNLPFMIKTYGAIPDSFEATSVLYRGLRAN